MLVRRAIVSAVLLVLAVLIEVTVLAPLPFPGATPTLVLVVVVILASQFGASTGAVAGFAGGLLLDIAPPAAGTIGITALLLTVVGYAVGRFAEVDDRPWWSFAVLAALAAPLPGGARGGSAPPDGPVSGARPPSPEGTRASLPPRAGSTVTPCRSMVFGALAH